jgi:hypothetical protein
MRQMIGTHATVSEAAAAATFQNTRSAANKARPRDILNSLCFIVRTPMSGMTKLYSPVLHRDRKPMVRRLRFLVFPME